MTKIFSFISFLNIMRGTHSGKGPSHIRVALQGLRGGKPYDRETNPDLSTEQDFDASLNAKGKLRPWGKLGMVNCKQRTVKSTRPSYCLDRWLPHSVCGVLVWSRGSSFGICGGRSGGWPGFIPSASVFTYQLFHWISLVMYYRRYGF